MVRSKPTSIWLLCLLLPGSVLTPGAVAALEHADLDTILSVTVQGELVDYGAVLAEHFESLQAYLDRMASVDVSDLARDEQLAYYINVYNATMIHVVAPNWKEGYSPSDDGFGVFDESVVRLQSGTVSLNHLEHQIIRKTFRDPRIHAALVCAAVSCPPLLPRAYRADDLGDALDANMRRFVRDTTRNRADHAAGKLHLSSIFDWFVEDFGGREALGTYVTNYLGRDVSGYDIVFLPYDWTLNATRHSE